MPVDRLEVEVQHSPSLCHIEMVNRIQTEAPETLLVIVLYFVIKRYYRFVVLTSSCQAATTVDAFFVEQDRRRSHVGVKFGR